MPLPTISEGEIRSLFPEVTSAEPIDHGGQKVVFRANYKGQPIALKFALLSARFTPENEDAEETVLRAARETQIMRDCTSPHIVKLGPIALGAGRVSGQNLLFFSEEFVDGRSLDKVLRNEGRLTANEVMRLGLQMCSAISDLWSLGTIHRDIKPGNIMRKNDGSGYA
jgi:serine/threonine-protein kinase